MAFDDFLAHFTQIEVAKTHRDWNAVTVPGIRISAGMYSWVAKSSLSCKDSVVHEGGDLM